MPNTTKYSKLRLICLAVILVKALGDKARDHIIATTSKSKGNLIKIAAREGYKTFYIPDGVGGRFSELCPVGLLPAAVLGIDIKGLLQKLRLICLAVASISSTTSSCPVASLVQPIMPMRCGLQGVVLRA